MEVDDKLLHRHADQLHYRECGNSDESEKDPLSEIVMMDIPSQDTSVDKNDQLQDIAVSVQNKDKSEQEEPVVQQNVSGNEPSANHPRRSARVNKGVPAVRYDP